MGVVKASWEGISGGAATEEAVARYFAELRERAAGPMSVPDPTFEVLGAEPVAHAAAPTMSFTLRVTNDEPLHAIALSTQINIDPARRTYDAETRERLVELFGAPERWAATTRSFLWTQVGALVPGFSGATEFTLTVPCTYDLELSRRRSTSTRCPTARSR